MSVTRFVSRASGVRRSTVYTPLATGSPASARMMSRYGRFSAEHPTMHRPSIALNVRPTSRSHGARSVSVSGSPQPIRQRRPDRGLAAARDPHQDKTPQSETVIPPST